MTSVALLMVLSLVVVVEVVEARGVGMCANDPCPNDLACVPTVACGGGNCPPYSCVDKDHVDTTLATNELQGNRPLPWQLQNSHVGVEGAVRRAVHEGEGDPCYGNPCSSGQHCVRSYESCPGSLNPCRQYQCVSKRLETQGGQQAVMPHQ